MRGWTVQDSLELYSVPSDGSARPKRMLKTVNSAMTMLMRRPIDIVATFNADLARMREVLPSSLAEQDIKTTLWSNWSVKGPDLDHLTITGRGSLTCPPIPTDYTYRTRDEKGKRLSLIQKVYADLR